eukprot:7167066-Pyramimonas_sp.AAC.1
MWGNRSKYQDANSVATKVPDVRGKAGPPLTEILTMVPHAQTRPISLRRMVRRWRMEGERDGIVIVGAGSEGWRNRNGFAGPGLEGATPG